MIESLQSPHIGRVKALLSSKKDRYEKYEFIAEGVQPVREALQANAVKTLYLTTDGKERLTENQVKFKSELVIEVSDAVAKAMSDATTPQGIIAICGMSIFDKDILDNANIIYLFEIQDPGNAGTILRSADAMGLDAVVTSPNSVDIYSPKVVRATAGSIFHIPIYQGIDISEFSARKKYVLSGAGEISLSEIDMKQPAVWIFGNEARGFKKGEISATTVSIPMTGNAESLNLSAAAAIVMHEISKGR